MVEYTIPYYRIGNLKERTSDEIFNKKEEDEMRGGFQTLKQHLSMVLESKTSLRAILPLIF